VLAAQGASVVLAGRRAEKLAAAANDIAAEGGVAVPLSADVTDAEQISGVLDRAQSELGQVSILVNNAGLPDAMWATKMPLELVDAVLATNLRAPFLLSCAVASRLMKAKRPGRIVNVSSMAAYSYDGHGAALYSITKAAVNRMTEVLSVEWAAFGINVNAIAPGAFNSEMMDGMVERMGSFHESFPRRRMGESHQLDSTLVFLTSDASEAVTGTIVKVDDGQGAK
jgi:NAD(P)-dependent dehydrogenase (short-subunit alcohol dehydrogenase family)